MKKIETRIVNNDIWEVVYVPVDFGGLIRAEVRKCRLNRKWWQIFKYSYRDFTYGNLYDIEDCVEFLLDNYYATLKEQEEISEFFETSY